MNNVHQVWELKLTAGGVEHVFVWIPPGRFLMGSLEGEGEENERPQHQVEITSGFWMGKYPVTVAQYLAFCREEQHWHKLLDTDPEIYHINGKHSYLDVSKKTQDKRPMVDVDWGDAQTFCKWMAEDTCGGLRPPYEAEWEYACRAGSTSKRYGEVDEVAWHFWNSERDAHVVGEKTPNSWGLYDMLGNVWEWCHDWYDHRYYLDSPYADPHGPETGICRVLRGGSWNSHWDHIRAACRHGLAPSSKETNIGFRLVRVQP